MGMRARVRRAVARGLPAAGSLVALIGQTTTNTTTITASMDVSAISDIIVSVIPLFVLIAIIKMLFRSFQELS